MCDEARPSCSRCASLGRPCRYYAAGGRKDSSQDFVEQSLSRDLGETTDNKAEAGRDSTDEYAQLALKSMDLPADVEVDTREALQSMDASVEDQDAGTDHSIDQDGQMADTEDRNATSKEKRNTTAT